MILHSLLIVLTILIIVYHPSHGIFIIALIGICYMLLKRRSMIHGGMQQLSTQPTRVNISQKGTIYSIALNCAYNESKKEVDCVTSDSILYKRENPFNLLGYVPVVGPLLTLGSKIMTAGTEMADDLLNLSIGTSKREILKTVDEVVDDAKTYITNVASRISTTDSPSSKWLLSEQ